MYMYVYMCACYSLQKPPTVKVQRHISTYQSTVSNQGPNDIITCGAAVERECDPATSEDSERHDAGMIAFVLDSLYSAHACVRFTLYRSYCGWTSCSLYFTSSNEDQFCLPKRCFPWYELVIVCRHC